MRPLHTLTLIAMGILAAVLVAMAVVPGVPNDIYVPGLEAPHSYPPLPKDPLPLEDRLNSTPLLLYAPVGGFSGPLYWVRGPETLTYNYTFYSRGFGPGNVTLTVTEVAFPLSTEPVSPSPGIETRISPDRFAIDPGEVVTAQFNVSILPEGFHRNTTTRTFRIHAETDFMPNAVADDWIRVRMGDMPVSWIDYQTRAEFDPRDITIRKGDRWSGNLTLRLGERETGLVHVWFKELDCDTEAMSSQDTPQPRSTGWPEISVSPDEFTGRSYGNYNLTTVIDTGSPHIAPGTYCYGTYIDTPEAHTSFSFTVMVKS